MNIDSDKVLCEECRCLQEFEIRTVPCTRKWNNKDYSFRKRVAYCKKCGNPVTVPGLTDLNESEFDKKCRELNDYILIDDVTAIIEKYEIEKRPLSNVLGLGEHTIENYLSGQLPSKRYSDMLRRVLTNYTYMQKLFESNKDKLNSRTANKLEEKLNYYHSINSHSTAIESIALYVLNSKYEITNMSLQKLLYYIEAFGQIILGKQVFQNRCEAWTYGPVYPEIYEKYKSFKGSPITVDAIDLSNEISQDVRDVIDHVLSNFAIYNGVTLKDLTHAEKPWIDAHSGYGEKEICEEEITHDAITEYFSSINRKYDLTQDAQVRKYIQSLNVL